MCSVVSALPISPYDFGRGALHKAVKTAKTAPIEGVTDENLVKVKEFMPADRRIKTAEDRWMSINEDLMNNNDNDMMSPRSDNGFLEVNKVRYREN
ncbi:hypothetical protein EVAR_55708_1 [Eumeta japonica]|uniref:Uncharacterized protein n=1 Tax=Eumeta variegata TaxID=151549 RepID=A0A4C1YZE6_EUMVA|nr:hypothetical protein EVAR_55708_1 [Eumeta japonica]